MPLAAASHRRKALPRTFLERADPTNYGRIETITGAQWTTIVNVELRKGEDWSVVLTTLAITADGVNWDGTSPAITARVMARIEQGSGDAISVTVIEATDQLSVPVIGNHIKVDLTLVSADTVLVPAGGANGLAVPAAASAAAAATVSAYLGKAMSHQPAPSPAGTTEHITPYFGNASTGISGVVSKSPIRLASVHATNTSLAQTVFLALVSQAVPVTTGPVPENLVREIVALPPGKSAFVSYQGSLPFDRGCTWVSSPTASPVTPSTIPIDVRAEARSASSVLLIGPPAGPLVSLSGVLGASPLGDFLLGNG